MNDAMVTVSPDFVAGLLQRARRAEHLYRHAAEEADDRGEELARLEDDVAQARACARAVIAGTATDPERRALANWADGYTPHWPAEVARP